MGFNGKSGYDCSYEINPSPTEAKIQRNKVVLQTCFMFERRKDGDATGNEVLGVEQFSETLPKFVEQVDDPSALFPHFTYRLNEYAMPSAQIQILLHDVLVSVPVSPVVINLKVCTVQLEGETKLEAMERSIGPDSLVPLDLVRTIGKKDKSWRRSRLRKFLLFGLPRVRGDGLLMETCPVCLDGPTGVAPVSKLSCGHSFHCHCLVRWLLNKDSCPMCRQDKIILLKEGGAKKTRARPSTNLPRRPRRGQGRPTRVRRVPSWHRDYVVRSTNHLPGPTRVRRTPTWHNDFIMGTGVSMRG